MSRISRHQMFMDVAHVFARRSTCMRLNVGAVIVADRRIIAHGYNGVRSGEAHCTGASCAVDGVCLRAAHAEENAIKRMSPFDITKVAELYVTDSPCLHCLKMIERLGTIRKLYYDRLYRVHDHLDLSSLEIYRVTANGMLVDHRTKELIEP